MRFVVKTTRRADRDYAACLNYIVARSKQGANSWATAFDKALERLEDNADGCPLALENDLLDEEIREVSFKTRRGLPYRVLFVIRDTTVFVIHVRGPGQDFMQADEIVVPHE
jgi:plasmid stabilization system protein ParE